MDRLSIPPGYLLPPEKTMADVLRLNDELLASETAEQPADDDKDSESSSDE